jgi:hypothetical protein
MVSVRHCELLYKQFGDVLLELLIADDVVVGLVGWYR